MAEINYINGYEIADAKAREDASEALENTDRINDVDTELQLEKLTRQSTDANLQTQINSLASGSPKDVYATVAALEVANPDTGVYIVSADGHIYSWTKDGSNATDLGVYQAAEIETDKTLSIDGACADSKAVGDNLDYITDKIEMKFANTLNEGFTYSFGAYGSKVRINRNIGKFNKIVLYTKFNSNDVINDTIYLRFWNIDENAGGSEIYSAPISTNNIEKAVEFIFDNYIELSGTDNNFFISIWSKNNKIALYGNNVYNNNEICSASDNSSNFYVASANNTTGDSGSSPSPKNAYYPNIEFYKEKRVIKSNSIDMSMLGDDIKNKIDPDKIDQEFFMPDKVFTWGDNILSGMDCEGRRVPEVGIYLDHAIEYGEEEKTLHFDDTNQKNKLSFVTPYPLDWRKSNVNNGFDKQEITRNYTIKGDKINDVSGTITQISVRNAVGENNFVALLTIGDSTVDGANAFTTSEEGQYFWNTFWNECARQFAMDSIEANDINKYKFMALGTRTGKGGQSTVEYLDKTRTIITATNGESGSKLADHLRYVSQHRPSQATWDLLGLGDGTGTDYTGTSAQKDLIAQTAEIYSGSESDFNGNPFYDGSISGNTKFSISKWLERYRTLDDNGNRLTLGSGTGTKITNENINQINVCTPTHVLLQTGLNDWSQVSVEQYIADMDIFVSKIKSQLPNAKIAITLFPDDPGTYFKELYPNIKDNGMRYLHERTRSYVTALHEHFKNSNDVDLLPFYFVMPPAVSISYRWVQNDDGTKHKVPFGPASNDYHANGFAHKAWGQQLYAWIKSTLIQ